MKKLNFGYHLVKGRNHGLISSYHRGGGHKKLYRFVDIFYNLVNVYGKVIRFEYDPYRSAKIILILYSNGILSYQLATENIKVGDYVQTKIFLETVEETSSGLSCPIRFVKVGSKISCLEYYPYSGGRLARVAGAFATLVKKYEKFALVKLPSGEFRLFSLDCLCKIGRLLGKSYEKKFIGKAGRNRWLGWRPIVRGRAMNPVDHPHGGRTNGGMVPSTPWGRIAKGKKTAKYTSSLRVKRL